MTSNTHFNQPLSGNDMPRFASPNTMMRLPMAETAEGLDACFIGIPIDIGASNRSGTRHGPTHVRIESKMIRLFNTATGAAPFHSLQVADVGDMPINTFDLQKTMQIIEDQIAAILAYDCAPLSIGGDHTLSLPVLRAIAKKHGPVAMVHVDAHSDTSETLFNEPITHGTPFRRAVEEGLLIPDKVYQIGLRGSGYGPDDYAWPREQGFTVVPAVDCWWKPMAPLMDEVRAKIGDAPCYISFDIDALDPSFAPGTGTPEVGGLNSWQALEIVRGCRGLNVIGGDMVEVSPPFDHAGMTALMGANVLFEMLCVLPKVLYRSAS